MPLAAMMQKMISPASHWIWREAAVGHILYLEQRARTWIIKLSCELITPSKRPGCFQEARKRLRKMTLISSFRQWNLFLFLETDDPGPGWNSYPLRLNHFRSSQPNVITMLSVWQEKQILDRFCTSSDNQIFNPHVDQIRCFYCCLNMGTDN